MITKNQRTPIVTRLAILFALAMGLGWMIQSAQATELSVLGGLGIHSGTLDPQPAGSSNKSLNTPVFGASLGFGSGPVGFETGAFYGAHRLRMEIDSSNYIDFKQTNLVIPALVRFHLASSVSVGVGGYYSLSLGDAKSTTTAGGVTGAEASSTKLDSDYGLAGSVRFQIPIAARVAFTIDGRYYYGLKAVSSGGSDIKFRDLQALGGFTFML